VLLMLFTFVSAQFVIDASNRQQVAAATIQLLELLTAATLQASSVLIVLNKRLMFCQMCINFIVKFVIKLLTEREFLYLTRLHVPCKSSI